MQGREITVQTALPLTIKRIGYLVSHYLMSTLTEAELQELEDWMLRSIQNQLLFAELILPYNIKADASSSFRERLYRKIPG